jgi:selenide,water dikinase
VLRPLQNLFRPEDYPDLLVGLEVADDAAVYRLNDELAVVQTLDFFTPIVDDPYEYGAIAAANAMSDVYAMGGEVVLALNIAAFPPKLPAEVVTEILRGGAEKVAEAGGVIAGGHTIDDEEPKYGLVAMGFVHPDQITTKAGAKPGDVLVLTKPLGVGIITTAAKGDVADPAHLRLATENMLTLNLKAARLMQRVGVHAATDITGFGLLGHSSEVAEKSGVGLRFSVDKLPFLDGALEYADGWLFPGGACNNQNFYAPGIRFAPDVSEEMQMLLFTPETSGGLLIAVPAEKLDELTSLFAAEAQQHWVVGEVVEGQGLEVLS